MRILVYIILAVLATSDLLPNSIQLSFEQRRRFDEIHLEVWAKGDINLNNIKYARFSFSYDTSAIYAKDNFIGSTDSLLADMKVSNPVADIISEFHNRNGYTAGNIQFDTSMVHLIINKTSQAFEGRQFYDKGRGSFVGIIPFAIKDSASKDSITGISWQIDSTYVIDVDEEDITSIVNYSGQSDFKVLGTRILFPVEAGTLLDRDYNYPFLTGSYRNKGFPVYYERTVDPAKFKKPGKTAPSVDRNVAFKLSYLDADSNETELGRFVESDVASSQIGDNTLYVTGEIGSPNTAASFITTSLKGGKIDNNNYRLPVRILIEYDEDYTLRLEELQLKLTQLEGDLSQTLPQREESEIFGISEGPFVMGRLFFLQLNGQNEYLKTIDNISTSTQLTVEAWVNLNIIRSGNSEPGIVASSAGEDATPVMGSKEGAWMLYLKDGKYPAFRVREIEGRGNNGYLGEVTGYYPIQGVASDRIIDYDFSLNWNYLSATVHNNEVKLYVNGELVDEYINTDAVDARMLTTIHPIWIGVNPNDEIDGNDYLPAAIKGVRVWRLALSQEEIRENAAKVLEPSNTTDFSGIRRGLQLYYELQGDLTDLANNETYQHGEENLSYVTSLQKKSKPTFRPDYPHIKLTSPLGNEGFLNTQGAKYQLRWISYEVGNTSRINSRDVIFEYTHDDGKTWTIAKDTLGRLLGGATSPDTETTFAYWSPYRNDDFSANLRSITPYSKKVKLRISGTSYFNQEDIYYTSDEFLIAPYFSIRKDQTYDIIIPDDKGMNFTTDKNMLECWVRPYRFPTESEAAFPLIEKINPLTGQEHYSLRLLPQGNLEFSVTDNQGTIRKVISDPQKPLIRPNSIELDSAWTHIAVYFDKNYNGSSYVLFMIDGNPQLQDDYIFGLGNSFETNYANTFPTYIGSVAENTSRPAAGYIGEIKEIRFWRGSPNNITNIDTLIKFVQGAQSIRADELVPEYRNNLFAVFSFNGGTFHNNGMNRTLATSINQEVFARYYNNIPKFVPVKPYIKLVEPVFKQKVENEETELKIRWVGFDYQGDYFPLGVSNSPPFLEYSLLGGGGNQTQPYQYVGSAYWSGNKVQSLQLPDSSLFKFNGTGRSMAFSALLDVSNADPDLNNDGKYNDQGPLSSTLTNVRFRLNSRYRIFNSTENIRNEGPLFSVIPATNLTVRVLPEGYHSGIGTGDTIARLGQTYADGGIKVYIYENNGGAPGNLIDSAESFLGYTSQSPFHLNQNNKNFANVDFVFPSLLDGEYWLVVDHRNHLPVMSRYPVTFRFDGNNKDTWQIESGWDFTSWNGVSDNILPSKSITPWLDGYFTAYGNASSNRNSDDYYNTALVFNNGKAGDTTNAIASMVGGDVNKDGMIDSLDISLLIASEGTSNYSADITGSGYINADDRAIVYRNQGRYSSLINLDMGIINNDNPDRVNSNKQNDNIYTRINKQLQSLNEEYDINLFADTEFDNNTVKLHIYIDNSSSPFRLGNATFAFSFDTTSLEYVGFEFKNNVLWGDAEYGYNPVRSSPDSSQAAVVGLRTIEIDYEANSGKSGAEVKQGVNYISTLVFAVNNEDVINFLWHPSTSVHNSGNKILNNDVKKIPIDPVFQYSFNLIEPNGGEEYRPGVPLEIKWNCDKSPEIYLEFSSNGQASWSRITENSITADKLSFMWTAPQIISSNCFIRAIDKTSGLEIDKSEAPFSIINGFAQIIRPSPADAIYSGNQNAEIIWSSQGYSKVRFEYSSNGGSSWNGIAGIYDATKGEANWRIPGVTTKNAVVRMIDVITQEEAARSGEFRILNGEFEFQLPRANQTLFVDRYSKIQWYANDVDYIDFDLSLDGGSTWKNLIRNVKGDSYTMNWLVKEPETDEAVIRAIWNGDDEMEYGRTGLFTITIHHTSVNDDDENFILFPNPSNGVIYIESEELISNINIINMNGINLINKIIMDNSVALNINELAGGLYFLEIYTLNGKITKKFIKE